MKGSTEGQRGTGVWHGDREAESHTLVWPARLDVGIWADVGRRRGRDSGTHLPEGGPGGGKKARTGPEAGAWALWAEREVGLERKPAGGDRDGLMACDRGHRSGPRAAMMG